jgi:hypothetical protein
VKLCIPVALLIFLLTTACGQKPATANECAQAYFTALVAGDAQKIRDLKSAAPRPAMNMGDEPSAAPAEPFASYTLKHEHLAEGYAVFEAEVTDTAGLTHIHRVLLVRDGDRWKVSAATWIVPGNPFYWSDFGR